MAKMPQTTTERQEEDEDPSASSDGVAADPAGERHSATGDAAEPHGTRNALLDRLESDLADLS